MAEFYDGFEQFRTDETKPVTYFLDMAKYISRGNLESGAGRLSNSVALFTKSSSFEREWVWAGDTITIGFACRQSIRDPIFGIRMGEDIGTEVPHVLVHIDRESALVTVTDGETKEVGYVTPLPNRWYYYEVVLTKSTRTIEVFVNGKKDVTFTLPAIFAQSSTMRFVFNPYDLSPNWVTPADVVFDDLYIRDAGRLGPIQISGRLPTEDISREWMVSSEDPAGAHWAMVGTMPPNPNDKFIFTAENAKLDSFKSNVKLPDAGRIIAHGLVALVRKATADPVTIVASIDGNTVSMANINRSWEYRYTLFPAGAYDKAAIEGATFGVKTNL